ncbi:MAG: S41 family peptidase [Patescibacteria group bacterium]|nr:S41 family peptidase [Patescibacteria group bacterium]
MKKILIKILISIIIVISGFALFSFGFDYGYQQIPQAPEELPSDVDITLLWDVWNRIEEKYPKDFDYQEMVYGAAKGLAGSLDDPYTTFFTPEDSKIFMDEISGEFQGVGMEISIKDGGLTVVTPLEGTPAQKAGLLPGDKIIKVEETYTKDMTIEEAVKMIRGKKGTKVKLSIYRGSWESTRDFEIIRDIIKIPSTKLEIIDGNIAKVNIYQFPGNLSYEFAKITDAIVHNDSIEKIILDLRNNPGGLLSQAQSMAGLFLERGDVVTVERFGGDQEDREYLAAGNELLKNYPLVILINQGSASASEILAAALRDNKNNVKLIGEKSFGKGSVQEPIHLRDGSLLKITVANWLTPNGKLIDQVGLEPDIVIEMTEEDYEEDRDPQLEKAIETLREI